MIQKGKTSESYRWRILGLMWLCAVAYGVLYQCIPPVLGMIMDSLGISHAEAGGLMSLFVLPGIFLAIPGGALADRYGSRIVGSLSLLVMLVGTGVAVLGRTYPVLGLGRMVAGLGATVFTVVLPRVTTAWFEDREIGLSMGILNTAMPLGTILSLSFLGEVGRVWGWRGALWIAMAICLVALVAFRLVYRDREPQKQWKKEGSSLRSGIGALGARIWWLSISWAFYNAGLMAYFTYAADYFSAQGLELSRAGRLASYPMWGSLVISPAIGILIDRIGGKRRLIGFSCGAAALLFYMIPAFPAWGAVLTLLLGVFVALVAPAIFTLPAEVVPRARMGLGFGVLNTIFGIGAMVGPLGVGVLRDATGDYRAGFTLMAVFAALGGVAIFFLKGDRPVPGSETAVASRERSAGERI